jgi:DNA modification methylase
MNNQTLEHINPHELKPYERNARTHSPEQIQQLIKSIEHFKFTNPVLIDENNGVLAGHGRIVAAQSIGMKTVPCVRLTHLSEVDKRAYILADNQLATKAGWDDDLLRYELGELKELNFDLDLTGFSFDEIEALVFNDGDTEGLTDPDDVPAVQDDPVSQLGDLWVLGEHRVLCGDSTKIADVERLMDGKKADMVFTDPPYGMHLDTDFSSMKSRLFKGKVGADYIPVIGDNDDFTNELINCVFSGFGYCKEIFLWGADYYAELLPFKNNGSWIVWDKRLDDSADKMYGSCFELCWSKGKHKRDIARIKWAGIFGMEKEPDKKRLHPTQKPVELIKWFFDQWGSGKDIVLDLFLGSGSTLIAAEKTNRICYGMELSPNYVDVIVKRWQDYTGRQAILEATGQTFDEVKQSSVRTSQRR